MLYNRKTENTMKKSTCKKYGPWLGSAGLLLVVIGFILAGVLVFHPTLALFVIMCSVLLLGIILARIGSDMNYHAEPPLF